MIERQQQEALYTDGTPVLAQDIFWEGRPSFLPFLQKYSILKAHRFSRGMKEFNFAVLCV